MFECFLYSVGEWFLVLMNGCVETVPYVETVKVGKNAGRLFPIVSEVCSNACYDQRSIVHGVRAETDVDPLQFTACNALYELETHQIDGEQGLGRNIPRPLAELVGIYETEESPHNQSIQFKHQAKIISFNSSISDVFCLCKVFNISIPTRFLEPEARSHDPLQGLDMLSVADTACDDDPLTRTDDRGERCEDLVLRRTVHGAVLRIPELALELRRLAVHVDRFNKWRHALMRRLVDGQSRTKMASYVLLYSAAESLEVICQDDASIHGDLLPCLKGESVEHARAWRDVYAHQVVFNPGCMLLGHERHPDETSHGLVQRMPLIADQDEKISLVQQLLGFLLNRMVDSKDFEVKLVTNEAALIGFDLALLWIGLDLPLHSSVFAIEQVAVDLVSKLPRKWKVG